MTPVKGSDGEVVDLTFATYDDPEAAAAAVAEAWAGTDALTEPDPALRLSQAQRTAAQPCPGRR